MEFNSQICTSIEQSERLLALGLKRETADCSWISNTSNITYKTHWRSIMGWFEDGDLPAWSLHRLIEIAGIMAFSPVSSIDGWYDDIIAQIQSLIHIGYIDEKYLNMDIVNAKENENMELLKNATK